MWSDRETAEDYLGFSNYVSVLAKLCVEKELAPLTIGIFGSWGSGKTSLMKMLKDHIDASYQGGNIRTLWFNPWRYEGKEEAQTALVHSILARLSEGKSVLQEVRDLLQRLKKGASVLKLAKFITKTAVTLTPDIKGFIDCFEEKSEELATTIEAFEKDFGALFSKMGIDRAVVFIDDLDRCLSEKVIETFETIKLFLDLPQCTFVIGADSAKIEHAIADVYSVTDQSKASFARDYLEKIVQIPFRIPEQQESEIACYIGMLVLQRYISEEGRKQLLNDRAGIVKKAPEIEQTISGWVTENAQHFPNGCERVVKEVREILPYVHILATGLRGNPRQLKRFLNILGLRQALAQENKLEVGRSILIKFVVLEYTWKDFFSHVVETLDTSSGRSDLIKEVLGAAKKGDDWKPDSELVTQALGSPGLVEFLAEKPLLDEVDLTPYLFLAQTALSRERLPALVPIDEMAKDIVGRIATKDRVRSSSAARQTALMEESTASAVVRMLIPEMLGATDTLTRTHIITGLDTICTNHPILYQSVVKALEEVDPKGQEPVAIVASSILANAEKAQVPVSEDLKDKFARGFKLVQALRKGQRGTRPH
jgi:hypothetical protein